MTQKEKLIQIAQAEVGKNAGGEKFWRWYGFDCRVSWCACFASWCLDQAGVDCFDLRPYLPKGWEYEEDLLRKEAKDSGKAALITKGCVQNLIFYEAIGARIGDEPAQAGDIILYNWDADDSVDHVGIIEYVEGNDPSTQIIHTIEGNWGDNVSRRTVTYRDMTVWAICRPKYDEEPIPEPKRYERVAALQILLGEPVATGLWTDDLVTSIGYSEMKKGNDDPLVQLMQVYLIDAGFGLTDGADGEFGEDTDGQLRRFQQSVGIDIDGVCGAETWKALCKVE